MELVASGLLFPEGPIALSDGSVLVVEIKRGTLTRVTPKGDLEVIAEVGGGPNGAAIGPDGAAYICNNGGFAWRTNPDGTIAPNGIPPEYRTGSIQRVDLKTGAVRTLYTECDGLALRGPNDIVFDAHGGMWFSDLGRITADAITRGSICYAAPDGSFISRQRSGLLTPNGVGLSPDQSVLYVAETVTGRLWALEIERPGVFKPPPAYGPGRLIATLPDYKFLDSLAVERDGRVCVATLNHGGIAIVDESSVQQALSVADDGHITNICFGGPDMRTAWITSSGRGRLYKTNWLRPGLRLNFNA